MTGPQDQPRPTPVAPDRPVVDARDPDALRADLEERRKELGDTVEELAHRADVPARMREKKDESVARVQQTVAQTTERVQQTVATTSRRIRQEAGRAQKTLAEKAPALNAAVRKQQRAILAGTAAVVMFLLVRARRRRRARRAGR